MWNWLKSLATKKPARHARKSQTRPTHRPEVLRLEDRINPVTSVKTLAQGLTPLSLAQNLVGTGITPTNVKYTGSPQSAGIFSGGQASIGISTGVVLSTGAASGVIGPNSSGGTTTSTGTGGDVDLANIAGTTVTNIFDKSVLEFDFKATGNEVVFNFVFGSEEYNEFVFSGVSDAFGFLINGVNIGLVPSSNSPISIDTINNTTNSTYFVDNTGAIFNTQMDGFTTVITIVYPVKQNATQHVKIAIGDMGDTLFDTAVFIQAKSLATPFFGFYNPVRWVYNSQTKTYDGTITVYNPTTTTIQGPMYVMVNFITPLPTGQTFTNTTGTTTGGKPYFDVAGPLTAGGSVKIFVKLSNPTNKPLPTFYNGQFLSLTNLQL